MCQRIKKIRDQKLKAQKGRCHYCAQPMWTGDPAEFCLRHRISLAQAKALQCTGEHLIAAQDGGKVNRTNIVAACFRCNTRRHKAKSPKSHVAYKAHVEDRMSRGKWHAQRLSSPGPARSSQPAPDRADSLPAGSSRSRRSG